jgi:hypothetical protein
MKLLRILNFPCALLCTEPRFWGTNEPHFWDTNCVFGLWRNYVFELCVRFMKKLCVWFEEWGGSSFHSLFLSFCCCFYSLFFLVCEMKWFGPFLLYNPFECRYQSIELESTFQFFVVWLHIEIELRFGIRDPILWNCNTTRNHLSQYRASPLCIAWN